jgi:hypothetical protein
MGMERTIVDWRALVCALGHVAAARARIRGKQHSPPGRSIKSRRNKPSSSLGCNCRENASVPAGEA